MDNVESSMKTGNTKTKGELEKLKKTVNEKGGISNETVNFFVNQQEQVKAGKRIALRKDVSNITIAEMYRAGFTAYKIAKHFGMTQQGVINRLKGIGLWKAKKKGNQFKKNI